MRTCVLGHGWNDGQVLCPTCGFGPRSAHPEPVAASVAAPAAVVVTAAAPVAEPPTAANRPRSEDGRWEWDGAAWQPVELAPLVPAQTAGPDPSTAPEPAAPAHRRARALSLRRPSPKVAVLAGVAVVALAGAGAYATGVVGGSSSPTPPGTSAAVLAADRPTAQTPSDLRVRQYLTRYAAAEKAAFAAHHAYPAAPAVAGRPAGAIVTPTAHGAAYCVVAKGAGAGAHWFAASSRHGGLVTTAYATRPAAVAACA